MEIMIHLTCKDHGYIITDDEELCLDNVFDYDSWEYFEGELQGTDRILKGVSNLMKNKIAIDTFIDVYEYIQNEKRQYLKMYTEEGLELAGLSKSDIEKIYN